METTKQRHSFVTFWLWFGIIINVIALPVAIMQSSLNVFKDFPEQLLEMLSRRGDDISSLGTYVVFLQIVTAICTIALIAGYYLMLKWKKKGFWINVVAGIANGVLSLILFSMIVNSIDAVGATITEPKVSHVISMVYTPVMAVIGIISVLVQWGILHIKKDGVSCWKQLE